MLFEKNKVSKYKIFDILALLFSNHKPSILKTMTYHLAQINIARMRGVSINDPIMADFVVLLDEINALAEASKGFVWRLKGDDSNSATDILPYDDERIIVNMSVWECVETLENYVFKSHHTDVLKRRREWFERFDMPATALWYIPVGHIPPVAEAQERLAHLQTHGASAYAFNFRKIFQASDLT
jgi:Domain of unknown function (DUF3291)